MQNRKSKVSKCKIFRFPSTLVPSDRKKWIIFLSLVQNLMNKKSRVNEQCTSSLIQEVGRQVNSNI